VEFRYFSWPELSPVFQEVASVLTLGKTLKKTNYPSFDVHLNYNSLFAGYVVSKAAKSSGIATLYDIADHLPAMVGSSPQIPFPLRLPSRFLADILVRRNAKIAERVTVTTRRLAISLGIAPQLSAVITNGVDTTLFKDSTVPELGERLGLQDAFVLGYAGVLREWIDLAPVFSAVRELSRTGVPVKLLLVGEEGGLAKNRTLAREHGVQDRVVFTGTVPYSQVSEYISCMDVCLLPFKNNAVSLNAVPLKLFEYMACRKPVISICCTGAVFDAVGNRVLYVSGSEELTERCLKIYKIRGLGEELGAEGQRFVRNYHSWERICSRLEQVLLEIKSCKR